jgi:hypothetical protein
MHFTITFSVTFTPELMDWSSGDGPDIKKFADVEEYS